MLGSSTKCVYVTQQCSGGNRVDAVCRNALLGTVRRRLLARPIGRGAAAGPEAAEGASGSCSSMAMASAVPCILRRRRERTYRQGTPYSAGMSAPRRHRVEQAEQRTVLHFWKLSEHGQDVHLACMLWMAVLAGTVAGSLLARMVRAERTRSLRRPMLAAHQASICVSIACSRCRCRMDSHQVSQHHIAYIH